MSDTIKNTFENVSEALSSRVHQIDEALNDVRSVYELLNLSRETEHESLGSSAVEASLSGTAGQADSETTPANVVKLDDAKREQLDMIAKARRDAEIAISSQPYPSYDNTDIESAA